MGVERTETRCFGKEATITIKVVDNHTITAGDIIGCIEDAIVKGCVYACIPRAADGYEVTVSNKAIAERLAQGVKCGEKTFQCNLLVSDTVVVSFLHLPAYILDEEIEEKLQKIGIKILSPIQRRYYKGTNVADGTRIVKVKFPKNIPSLSYLMKFDTVFGSQLFRVIHNDQAKVCALCYSQDHLMIDCEQYTCYKCEGRGHMKKQCTATKCVNCGLFPKRCQCSEDDEDESDDFDDEDEESEYEDEKIVIDKTQDVRPTLNVDSQDKGRKTASTDKEKKMEQKTPEENKTKEKKTMDKPAKNHEKGVTTAKDGDTDKPRKTQEQSSNKNERSPCESEKNNAGCDKKEINTREVPKQTSEEPKQMDTNEPTLNFNELRTKRKSNENPTERKRRPKIGQQPKIPTKEEMERRQHKLEQRLEQKNTNN